jgi:uncharacterized protein
VPPPRINYRDTSPTPGPPHTRMQAWIVERPQIPYLLPLLAYLVIMAPATFGHFAGIDWKELTTRYHPLQYALESTAAAIVLWIFWPYYTRIRWTHIPPGIAVGLFGTALWILTEYACQHIGISRPPNPADVYNPDLHLHSTKALWIYFCIRIIGPSLVVPPMEELFFRDFLMRALIRGGGARFQDVPIGAFSWFSLLGMSALFGMNHGAQWPEGVLYGLLMGILLIRTKSLGACIVAHGITNWTLYLYVLYTGDWQFM